MTFANPYSKKPQFTTVHGEPLAGNKSFTAIASAEPLVGANGELNASSQKELLRQTEQLALASSSGKVVDQNAVSSRKEMHEALVTAAANGIHSDDWTALGSSMAVSIEETLGREGFANRLLEFQPLSNGEDFKIRSRHRDTRAYVSGSAINTVASQARQPFVRPGLYYNTANITIEQMEIAQDTGDLLSDRYEDGLEAILVGRDRQFIKLADTAAVALNNPFFFDEFTPTVMHSMKMEAAGHGGIPVINMLVDFKMWTDILSNAEFQEYFSQIAKHEILLQGSLGTLSGMQVITDGFRIPTLKVLEEGSVYMFGAPKTLGAFGQVGDLSVKATDHAVNGKPTVGWYITSIEGMALVNARAVVKGRRAV